MIKSLYTPLSGALAQEKVLDIISNNLANMNTVGFKGESISFKLLEPEPYKNYVDPLPPANYKIPFDEILPLRGNDVAYVGVSGVSRDTSQGPVITTHNPLDLMIEGEGYLTVMTREGERYTRAGSLAVNENGILVDKLGNPILGKKGDILLQGNSVKINTIGEIYQEGLLVDQLRITKFKDERQLERVGDNNYFFTGTDDMVTSVEMPTVRQGFLEGSNVNAIQNLTQMILTHRSYEAYQKALKNYDSMMEKSSNSIGEVRG